MVDPATVRFTVKEPFSPLLNNLTLNTGRIVSPAAVKKWAKEFASHPVGHRPVQVRELGQERADRARGERRATGPVGPKLERIVFRPLVEEQTRVTELMSGGVDFIVDVPPDNVAQVKKDARLAYYEQPGPHIWWVTLNTQKKPFNDVRVRRAVNHAVNRDAHRERSAEAHRHRRHRADPAVDHVGLHRPGDEVSATTRSEPRSCWPRPGYPNGFPAVFWIPESGSGMQSPKTMAQAIQADLAAVGVTASIQTFEWGAYLEQVRQGIRPGRRHGRHVLHARSR